MTAERSIFWRFFHWGPITALSIIKCITLTTLYMNSMWWPPNQSFAAFLNQAIFFMLSLLASYNYVAATMTGPGFLPKKWSPKNPKDSEHLQYCKICEGYKAPRSHHCRKCNRCVKKMDHHCPWINNCVGWSNHAYFTYFLSFAILGSLQASVILCSAFYRGIYRYYYLTHGYAYLATVRFTMTTIIFCILSIGLAIGVIVGLSMLLYIQVKTILSNQTGIEIWIVEKALYRRYNNIATDEFIYPYDLGWKQNIKQVFKSECQKRGDGVAWRVREGCDQFTLTREQLAQKADKRARTETYKCIRRATGSWCPWWSQGFNVCITSPFTDEPRIRLIPGDIIKVTRKREHWLFGERVLNEDENCDDNDAKSKRKRKGAIRGWFPRRCAVALSEANTYAAEEKQQAEKANEINAGDGKHVKALPYQNGHSKTQNGRCKKHM